MGWNEGVASGGTGVCSCQRRRGGGRRAVEPAGPWPPGRGTAPAIGWKALRACNLTPGEPAAFRLHHRAVVWPRPAPPGRGTAPAIGCKALRAWFLVPGGHRRAVERSRLSDARPCGPGFSFPAGVAGPWNGPGYRMQGPAGLTPHSRRASPIGASISSRAASGPRRWSGGPRPPTGSTPVTIER